MNVFNGYFEQTVLILIALRMNNDKQWFSENKEDYNKYVREPTEALGAELFARMREFDENFNFGPKVSRVNRDIRFSKIKLPYKENKWILFRTDSSEPYALDAPTYFFEITPEYYRYGLGFWPSPKKMAEYRKKIDAQLGEITRLSEWFGSQSVFKTEHEYYKRQYGNGLHEWYSCKNLTFICYREHDKIFLERDLLGLVFDGYKALHPLYSFLMGIPNPA